MTREQETRLNQAEWLCRNGFDHTADVLLYWDDPKYVPMPPPRDAVMTRLSGSGIFPAGPS